MFHWDISFPCSGHGFQCFTWSYMFLALGPTLCSTRIFAFPGPVFSVQLGHTFFLLLARTLSNSLGLTLSLLWARLWVIHCDIRFPCSGSIFQCSTWPYTFLALCSDSQCSTGIFAFLALGLAFSVQLELTLSLLWARVSVFRLDIHFPCF